MAADGRHGMSAAGDAAGAGSSFASRFADSKSRFENAAASHRTNNRAPQLPVPSLVGSAAIPVKSKPAAPTLYGYPTKPDKNGKTTKCLFPACFIYVPVNDESEFCKHLAGYHMPKALFESSQVARYPRKQHVGLFLAELARLKGCRLKKSVSVGSIAEALLKCFRQQKLHKCLPDCRISAAHEELVREYHVEIADPLPVQSINIHQPNCIAALTWWRHIVDLMMSLKSDEIVTLQKKWAHKLPSSIYKAPPSPSKQGAQQQRKNESNKASDNKHQEKKVATDDGSVTDAYFRLDLLMRNEKLSVSSILAPLGPKRPDAVCVAGFENPYLYPTKAEQQMISDDSRIRCSIGLDPSLCSDLTSLTWHTIEQAFKLIPKVVAVGAIGLDYTLPRSQRHGQLEALTRMCEFAKQNALPVVVECKENPAKPAALEANKDCIRALQKVVPIQWQIIKKSTSCFDEVHIWHEAFPKTVFGLNSLLLKEEAPPSLATFVAMVDLNHVVLHSNAPHDHPDGRKAVNSPSIVKEVAEEVGNLKGKTYHNILNRNYHQILKIYDITGSAGKRK